jgi:hypothetical protein
MNDPASQLDNVQMSMLELPKLPAFEGRERIAASGVIHNRKVSLLVKRSKPKKPSE